MKPCVSACRPVADSRPTCCSRPPRIVLLLARSPHVPLEEGVRESASHRKDEPRRASAEPETTESHSLGIIIARLRSPKLLLAYEEAGIARGE